MDEDVAETPVWRATGMGVGVIEAFLVYFNVWHDELPGLSENELVGIKLPEVLDVVTILFLGLMRRGCVMQTNS